jgi:hypothetical protein
MIAHWFQQQIALTAVLGAVGGGLFCTDRPLPRKAVSAKGAEPPLGFV